MLSQRSFRAAFFLPELPVVFVSQALSSLNVPAGWQIIDFVADLHLQQDDANWQAFAAYLQQTPADAVFLLGDVLELWAGDDALQHPEQAFVRQLVQALKAASQYKALYLMHGNRDFLLGPAFCEAAGLTLLHDPCVLDLAAAPVRSDAEQRVLLSHGDALCIDDAAYMQFRQQVRNPAWQQMFLQQPLEQRLALARQLREQSSQRKTALGVEGYADVDAPLAAQRLREHGCGRLVHGHTHKPQDHALPTGPQEPALLRQVLSDWDLLASPPRAEALRLQRLPCGTWQWSRQGCG